MLNIKISLPGFSGPVRISQFVGNDQNIGFGCKFYINDPTLHEADYWFVIENLQAEDEFTCLNKSNIHFLSAEVVHEKGYYDKSGLQSFLDQFETIFTCHDIYRENTVYALPFLPWMINSNHGTSIFGHSTRGVEWLIENNSIEKTKTLSVFCSNQMLTADHRLRLKFVKAIKAHFGDSLDWYGNGINPLPEKWDGIAPYKYHIVLENQSRNNIVTEKLYDSFLGLAYPIYYGAPNVDKYFSANSLTQIDIMDINGSIKEIEGVLSCDAWANRKAQVIESKNKVVTDYNVFRRIAEIAASCEVVNPNKTKERIHLRSIRKISNESVKKKLTKRAGIFLQSVSNTMNKMGE
jgi:Glycosyltransferase family 10 (fucosyltransferase) C-term